MILRIYMEDDTADVYLGSHHVYDYDDLFKLINRLYKFIRLKKKGL